MKGTIEYKPALSMLIFPAVYTDYNNQLYDLIVSVLVDNLGNMEITEIKWNDVEPSDSDEIEDLIRDTFFDTNMKL